MLREAFPAMHKIKNKLIFLLIPLQLCFTYWAVVWFPFFEVNLNRGLRTSQIQRSLEPPPLRTYPPGSVLLCPQRLEQNPACKDYMRWHRKCRAKAWHRMNAHTIWDFLWVLSLGNVIRLACEDPRPFHSGFPPPWPTAVTRSTPFSLFGLPDHGGVYGCIFFDATSLRAMCWQASSSSSSEPPLPSVQSSCVPLHPLWPSPGLFTRHFVMCI